MNVYTVEIEYMLPNDITEKINRSGFTSAVSASEWLSEKLSWFVMNWGEVNPDGITVVAEVYNQRENFSDMYELKCGL